MVLNQTAKMALRCKMQYRLPTPSAHQPQPREIHERMTLSIMTAAGRALKMIWVATHRAKFTQKWWNRSTPTLIGKKELNLFIAKNAATRRPKGNTPKHSKHLMHDG